MIDDGDDDLYDDGDDGDDGDDDDDGNLLKGGRSLSWHELTDDQRVASTHHHHLF